MEDLKADELHIQVGSAPKGPIRLDWKGKSSTRDPGKLLKPFFEHVLVAAQRRTAAIEMHFEKLEHFNSSTIAEVIAVIHRAQAVRVPLTLHYDGKLRWQALSFEALQRALKPFEATRSSELKIIAVSPP